MGGRVLFLDFGGTLVAPIPDPVAALARFLRSAGLEVPADRWTRAERTVAAALGPEKYALLGQIPAFLDRFYEAVLEQLGVPDHEGRIERTLHDWFTSVDLHPPYPESEAVLRALRAAQVPIHVVSNHTDWLLEILDNLGWKGYFASVTYSQEAGAEKPDRRIFDLALSRAGCAPEDVVHVGDSWEADVEGARRAGLTAIWLNRTGRPAPGPCEALSDLRALPARLLAPS